MEFGLLKKNAFVCASSEGIGKGIAYSLAKEGANVCLISRGEEKLKSTCEEINSIATGKVVYKVCDLSSEKQINEAYYYAVKELGDIDILINNQGGPKPGELLDLDNKSIEDAININLRSVMILCKLCIPNMVSNKWGRVVNVLSLSAKEPMKKMLLSNMVRPAVLGISKSLASQYAGDGITVNSLLPNAVLSSRTEYLVKLEADELGISYEQCLSDCAKALPIGRIAATSEIGDLTAFLCSDKASYLNGVALPVDGGFSRSLL